VPTDDPTQAIDAIAYVDELLQPRVLHKRLAPHAMLVD
jgi:hypothetical protein